MAAACLRAVTRILATVTATTVLLTAAVAPAVAAAKPKIAFSGIGFSTDHVDTTTGGTTVTLNWTVTDTSTTARDLNGSIYVRRFSGTTAVGPVEQIRFGLNGGWPVVGPHTGGIASSSYAYDVLVSEYGPAAPVTYRVTKITATDDQGTTRTMSGDKISPAAVLTATQTPDTAPPATEGVWLASPTRPYVYDSGSGATLRYGLYVQDEPGAGFWKGRLVLDGPGTATIVSPFTLVDSGQGYQLCGDSQVWDIWFLECNLPVTLPVGSPTGEWAIRSVSLTDRAGNTRRFTDLDTPTVRVTRNEVINATGFALNPTQVNNWRESASTTLTFTASGVQGALTATVETRGCSTWNQVLTEGPAGTYSLPVVMSSLAPSCTIDGILLTDAAGSVSVYGTHYGGPGLDLQATRVPDTTRPVATAAALSRTEAAPGDLFNGITVDVTIDDVTLAPVTGFSTTIYNSLGHSVGGAGGGISVGPDGHVSLPVHFRDLPPGTYTVGFSLSTSAGNRASWGYPNSGVPAPSGPLVFTSLPAA
ncbi:hypothetical protein GA0070616_2814 [Micromonospora nigra]|uniref:Ig-like domain (Group 3) n=1 Tax=Micromonospora nigra TaxID=145857 RepID=A0A1C6S330_9ACTN|nr:hypothetical protein [Micromonospora nigra]SCL23902.1 hypothetical protein GA0070616_2814 [Micromonospora nigra]